MSNLVGSVLPLRTFSMVDSMDMGPFRDLVASCEQAPYTIDPSILREIRDIIERFETNQEAVQGRIRALQQPGQGTIERVTRAIQHSDVVVPHPFIRWESMSCVALFLDFMQVNFGRYCAWKTQDLIAPFSDLSHLKKWGKRLLNFQHAQLLEVAINKAGTPFAITMDDIEEMRGVGGILTLMYEDYFRLVLCARRIKSLIEIPLPETKAKEEANLCDKVTEWLAEETRIMRAEEGKGMEIERGDVPLPLLVAGAIIGENSKLLTRVAPLHTTAILSQIKKIMDGLIDNSIKGASNEPDQRELKLITRLTELKKSYEEEPIDSPYAVGASI